MAWDGGVPAGGDGTGFAAVISGYPRPLTSNMLPEGSASGLPSPSLPVEVAGIEPARQRLQGATATSAVTPGAAAP